MTGRQKSSARAQDRATDQQRTRTGQARTRQLRLGRLPFPDPAFDPALQLKATPKRSQQTGKSQKGFETHEDARREDKFRVRSIERLIGSREAGRFAEKLMIVRKSLKAGLFHDDNPNSPASALYMRWIRRIVGGGLVKLAQEVSGAKAIITCINDKWGVPEAEVLDFDVRRMMAQFRADVLRASAGAPWRTGGLIAFMDCQYLVETKIFQFHIHGFAWGDAVGAVRALKQARGYRKTDADKPVKIQRLSNPQRQLSYVLKGFWPARIEYVDQSTGEVRLARRKRRIPGLAHGLFLLKRDTMSLDDASLLMGVRAGSRGFVPTSRRPGRPFSKRTQNLGGDRRARALEASKRQKGASFRG